MKFKLKYICIALAAATGPANALDLTNVPTANTKTTGFAVPNIVSEELDMRLQATGSMKLDGATATTKFYGYIDNPTPNPAGTLPATTMLPVPGNVDPTKTILPLTEASKTEPDKNTYLVLEGQKGADANYNYGTHFLFQGHEVGGHGYITRINLDADGSHRVTLMADTLADGSIVPNIDGSTWNPFTGKLMFTGEENTATGVTEGVVLEATTDFPSTASKLEGGFGFAGYEGIQVDSDGNIWLVSDVGGGNGITNTKARQPNSFIYRFVPKDKTNLTLGGKLQALQVMKLDGTDPIVFHAGQADADILSQDVKDLHTYHNTFNTNWVTVHDTDVNGFDLFNAGDAAKAANATPFKRPENGVFRPTAKPFTQFFFTETGDTNALSQAAKPQQPDNSFGGFGGLFSLTQAGPSANTGKLQLFFLSDLEHGGFDNIQFLTTNDLLVVEDAGDTVHSQRNALDSGYKFDVRMDYSVAGSLPVRFLAEGRDASATLDSATSGLQQNADNEITGIHVSNGDPTVAGLLGAKKPSPFHDGWRVFWNQQHGDNNSWEIVKNKKD